MPTYPYKNTMSLEERFERPRVEYQVKMMLYTPEQVIEETITVSAYDEREAVYYAKGHAYKVHQQIDVLIVEQVSRHS